MRFQREFLVISIAGLILGLARWLGAMALITGAVDWLEGFGLLLVPLSLLAGGLLCVHFHAVAAFRRGGSAD